MLRGLRRWFAREAPAAAPHGGLDAMGHARLYQDHLARGERAQAAAALESALQLRPDWTDARFNLGAVLIDLDRLQEAEAAYRRVIDEDPGRLIAYRLLGHVLHRQGRVEELLETLQAARRRHPADFELESFELLALMFSDRVSADELFARHRAFGARLEAAVAPGAPPPPPSAARLKVGYLSGDFCSHPVAQFLQPMLRNRDAAAFSTYCYSVGARVDAMTRALQAQADGWRDATALSDEQLAQLIRADGIDVLVDLSGHSGVSRSGVFARRAARTQLAWLGYLHSTGLTRIQYRVCDRHTDPPGEADRRHTESLLRLPHSQWCYRPLVEVAEPGPPPCLRTDHVTFGSLNQVAKLSPSTRRLWIEILRRAPRARLLLLGIPEGPARAGLLRDFSAAGIDPARLTLRAHVPVGEYFRCIDAIDIALDTTPYSGGTTTCDTLWMGVPVVTLEGERSASRSAAGILRVLELPEWCARSPEEYVAIALGLAQDRVRLGDLRRTLRPRMRRSPLSDESRFARDMEALYRAAAGAAW